MSQSLEMERLIQMALQLGKSKPDALAWAEVTWEKQCERDKQVRAHERDSRAMEREIKKIEFDTLGKNKDRELALREQELELKKRELNLIESGVMPSPNSVPTQPTVANTSPDLKLKLPMFKDGDDIFAFLFRFEHMMELTKVPDADRSIHLGSLLTGKALNIYSTASLSTIKDYYMLKHILLRGFSRTPDNLRAEFKKMTPGPNESYTQYWTLLRRAYLLWLESSEINKQDPDDVNEFHIKDQFLSSVNPELRARLKEQKFDSIEDFLDAADRFTSAHKSRPKPKLQFNPPLKSSLTPLSEPPKFGEQKNSKDWSGLTCFACGVKGHPSFKCPKFPKGTPTNQVLTNLCFNNNDLFKSYVVCGTVNGSYVSTILRDTGCSAILVSEQCLPFANTKNSRKVSVTDYLGRVSYFPIVKCYIRCQYFDGYVDAIRAPLAHCSVLIGNVPGVSDDINIVFDVPASFEPNSQSGFTSVSSPLLDSSSSELSLEGNKSNIPNRPLSVSDLNSKLEEVENSTEMESKPTIQCVAIGNVITRSKLKQNSLIHPLVAPTISSLKLTPDEFSNLQASCASLSNIRKQAELGKLYHAPNKRIYKFKNLNGVLINECIESPKLSDIGRTTLIAPFECRRAILDTAHEGLLSGHFSAKKTEQKIRDHFYWPGMYGDISRYTRSCDVCQRFGKKGNVKVPLVKTPIISEPFHRVSIDIVGPLNPPSEAGHKYILTMIDCATSFPEAIPMKRIDSISVAEALLSIFARVGIPKEVHSDLGRQFISELIKELHSLLGSHPLFNTPYHPQGTGRVERMHGTLKSILKKLCKAEPNQWHRYLIPTLFAMREMPSDRTGFSAFELLYGRSVRGPLAVLRDLWENPSKDPKYRDTFQYVLNLRNILKDCSDLAAENSTISEKKYRGYYDLKTVNRSFDVGDEVLILLPDNSNKLLMSWRGPFKIIEKRNRVDYLVDEGRKKTLYHINLLKRYYRRVNDHCHNVANAPDVDYATVGPPPILDNIVQQCVIVEESSEVPEIVTIDFNNKCEIPKANKNAACPDGLHGITISSDLSTSQRRDIINLLCTHNNVISTHPGCCNIIEHKIKLLDKNPVKAKFYPVPLNLRSELELQLDYLLAQGIIEPSVSPYSAPCLMIKKSDSSYRLAIDYRNLNSVTEFDAEPAGSLTEELHKFVGSKYFTELDLCQAYYQIPLESSSRSFSAFATHKGLFQFTRMPFGMVTACATYVRLMREVLKDLEVSFYFDNILVYSKDWKTHLLRLHAVLERLGEHGLTLKPSKMSIGMSKVKYLGYLLSENGISPDKDKVSSLLNCPAPVTKTAMRSFIGFCTYYSKFIPNYSSLTSPLSDLLKKGVKEPLPWNNVCAQNFETLKKLLNSEPVLKLPDPSRPFVVRTDASLVGIGSVLLQYYDGIPFPIAYASRKLLDRETRYSTIERELLGIVFGIDKFKYFLIAKQFILEVDHRPLIYLNKFKGNNSRLLHWALALQSYDFRIVHIPGSCNIGADYLSRAFT